MNGLPPVPDPPTPWPPTGAPVTRTVAPDGKPFLTRARLVFDALEHWLDEGPAESWHATFDEAMRAGEHAACLNACRWVTVHGPDGTLECHWRQVDEHGERDNLFHTVGPLAKAHMAEFIARTTAQMHARNAASRERLRARLLAEHGETAIARE